MTVTELKQHANILIRKEIDNSILQAMQSGNNRIVLVSLQSHSIISGYPMIDSDKINQEILDWLIRDGFKVEVSENSVELWNPSTDKSTFTNNGKKIVISWE